MWSAVAILLTTTERRIKSMRTSGEMRIISANRMHDIPYSKIALDVSTEEYTPGKTCIVASSCCDTNLEYILAEF